LAADQQLAFYHIDELFLGCLIDFHRRSALNHAALVHDRDDRHDQRFLLIMDDVESRDAFSMFPTKEGSSLNFLSISSVDLGKGTEAE
jgi:hypothetical protein